MGWSFLAPAAVKPMLQPGRHDVWTKPNIDLNLDEKNWQNTELSRIAWPMPVRSSSNFKSVYFSWRFEQLGLLGPKLRCLRFWVEALRRDVPWWCAVCAASRYQDAVAIGWCPMSLCRRYPHATAILQWIVSSITEIVCMCSPVHILHLFIHAIGPVFALFYLQSYIINAWNDLG